MISSARVRKDIELDAAGSSTEVPAAPESWPRIFAHSSMATASITSCFGSASPRRPAGGPRCPAAGRLKIGCVVDSDGHGERPVLSRSVADMVAKSGVRRAVRPARPASRRGRRTRRSPGRPAQVSGDPDWDERAADEWLPIVSVLRGQGWRPGVATDLIPSSQGSRVGAVVAERVGQAVIPIVDEGQKIAGRDGVRGGHAGYMDGTLLVVHALADPGPEPLKLTLSKADRTGSWSDRWLAHVR